MKRAVFKRIGLVLTVVVVIAVTVALLWQKPPPKQIITLANGGRYEFAGATYAIEDTVPLFMARLAKHLPTRLAGVLVKFTGPAPSQFPSGTKYDMPPMSSSGFAA